MRIALYVTCPGGSPDAGPPPLDVILADTDTSGADR